MTKSKATPAERFAAKIEKTDSCWLWTAAKDRDGYGQFKLDGRMRPAHRVSYEFEHGQIPDGMEIDHECLHASCVRPEHLRLATRKQNSEHTAGYANSGSGVRGVGWHRKARKWSVRVNHDGQVHYLGLFVSMVEAEAAAIAKRNELYTHNALDRDAQVVGLANTGPVGTE